MAATNWTIIKRKIDNKELAMFPIETKWTYKTALAIAQETNNGGVYELVCVVETNKIMIKDEKKTEKKR